MKRSKKGRERGAAAFVGELNLQKRLHFGAVKLQSSSFLAPFLILQVPQKNFEISEKNVSEGCSECCIWTKPDR